MLNRSYCAVAALAVSIGGVAEAGVLTVDQPNNNFDSAIDGSATYTHAVNIGAAVTVNGVNFDGLPAGNAGTSMGNSYALAGLPGTDELNINFNNGIIVATGASAAFAPQFWTAGLGTPGGWTLTLDGLTPGELYQTDMFFLAWNDDNVPSRDGTLTEIGAGVQGSFDMQAGHNPADDNRNGTLVSYQFTASGTSVVLQFDNTTDNASSHIHAFSNKVVPEPSSLALLALGGLAVLRRRRA